MALDELDVDTFIRRFARLLGRSRKLSNEHKHRLRRIMALNSLLRMKKLKDGTLTLNDYHAYIMATVADPSLPAEVRRKIKDVAVEVFFPDDEPVFREDRDMEKLIANLMAGNELDFEKLFKHYLDGSLNKAMDYLYELMQREGIGYPVRRQWGRWGPDRLVKLALFHSLYGSPGSSAASELARKLLKNLNDAAGNLHRKRTVRYGLDEGEIKRPFSLGDDIDSIDFEETVESIVGSGKQLEQVTGDDIVVKDQIKEDTTVVFLHDISISMREYLIEMIPCFVTTYYAFRRARKGFTVFTGDAYPIKSVLEEREDDHIIEQYYRFIGLSLQRRLQRGSMGNASFKWAESELEKAPSGRKIVFLFSDCDFNAYGSPLNIIRRMTERNAEVVVVHPHREENIYGYYGFSDIRTFEKAGCQTLGTANYQQYIAALEEIL
ncbi:MAG: VWA domain-containing protein [Thaumarchaeota archaeon]|nr:VWA domain-containing protein [Nitrososphaerota archaeon]